MRALIGLLVLTENLKDIEAQNMTTTAIVSLVQDKSWPEFGICCHVIRAVYTRTKEGRISRRMVAHLARDVGKDLEPWTLPIGFGEDLLTAYSDYYKTPERTILRTCPLDYYFQKAESVQDNSARSSDNDC
jgi:hypothetical protein